MIMRVLTDEEAHVLLLEHVLLIPSEVRVADRLVDRGYLTVSLEMVDGHEETVYDLTSIGDSALQCYRALKSTQWILK